MQIRTNSTALVVLICFLIITSSHADEPSYRSSILEDSPVAYWDFSGEGELAAKSLVGAEASLAGAIDSGIKVAVAGPRPKEYPLFDADNRAIALSGAKGIIRIADPGDDSVLDFTNGDAITIEAWVRPETISNDQHAYILGKGRTQNKGFPAENQNYALRLRGMGGTARVSFLFRGVSAEDKSQQYYRWNTDLGITPDGTWHHVAVVYEFGKPENVRAYIDGEESGGSWDMGGPTQDEPIVDNDELWIGSTLGGHPHTTFPGQLDEIAIYRKALPAERLKSRYKAIKPDPREAEHLAAAHLDYSVVLTEVYENVPAGGTSTLQLGEPATTHEQSVYAFVGFPKKYTSTGVIADRSNPLLLRARSRRIISDDEAGEYELLLRSRGLTRLYIDGKLVTHTNHASRNSSGHEEVPVVAESKRPDLRALPPATQERLVKVNLEAGEFIIRLDAIIGGKGLRLELDELCVAIARLGEPFELLAGDESMQIPLTDESWDAHRGQWRRGFKLIDQRNRRESAREWKEYWDRRHELARDTIEQQAAPEVPVLADGMPANNKIDHFTGAKLAAAGNKPAALTDDFSFLRRVALDTVGVVPSRTEIAKFVSDTGAERRSKAIARYLDDPRWADHWVGYWQDVLAENPGILKPKLNNTGPFRWWIYESFFDNKPMDQFVTELVMMEGSKYYGGPAGFAMATQNDVPFAAKAHVLAKAFLAMDMTCARCHDAPYHPFKQRELFSIAAMLERKPITLPKTSTVPLAEGARKPLVEITLKPGEKIAPHFPFASLSQEKFDAGVLRKENDQRESLAASLTSAHQNRFAKVIVNRLWQRYLGRGLIDPVDDWESVEGKASHPLLLDYLAHEFVLSGYDMKHAATLILTSHTYQREAAATEAPQLFASPARRRMSAEQLVDSLYAISGKAMGAEALTLDPDGRRPVDSFLNLGEPDRAWQLTSLSNERDRPALALPMSQSIIDLLRAYGWRDSRPNPLTVRDDSATVLQPLALANGVVGSRAVRLSDDSLLTELAIHAIDPASLVDHVALQILSRQPTDAEREMFVAMIADGFSDRVIRKELRGPRKNRKRHAVSWSNHLSAEATRIKQEIEREIRAGDPPSERLMTGWRERMEDVVWAMLNSPEFVFVP